MPKLMKMSFISPLIELIKMPKWSQKLKSMSPNGFRKGFKVKVIGFKLVLSVNICIILYKALMSLFASVF